MDEVRFNRLVTAIEFLALAVTRVQISSQFTNLFCDGISDVVNDMEMSEENKIL